MIKSLHTRWVSLVTAMAFAMGLVTVGSADEPPHMIFPPLQLFTEVCIEAGYSLNELSRLAELHHAVLGSSESVPMPDGSRSQRQVWQVQTEFGPIGIIGIAGINASNNQTFTCSVTAPASSVGLIQSWCKRSFGKPAAILDRASNAIEIHWSHTIGGEKDEVILLTQMPNQQSSLLSLVRRSGIRKRPP